MVKSYEVSAFYPAGPGLVLHALTVEVEKSIEWVKAHAEEIAAKAVGPKPVCALWVKELEIA